MGKPEIQNDFSFYRRSLNRMIAKNMMLSVKDELANKMSLFFAYPTPMLNSIIESINSFLEKNAKGQGFVCFYSTGTAGKIAESLANLSNVCHDILLKSKYSNPETKNFCSNLMVATAVLYDHVSDHGAFVKSSPINVVLP